MHKCGFTDHIAHELAADNERRRQHKVLNALTTRAGPIGAKVFAYARLSEIPVVVHIFQVFFAALLISTQRLPNRKTLCIFELDGSNATTKRVCGAVVSVELLYLPGKPTRAV